MARKLIGLAVLAVLFAAGSARAMTLSGNPNIVELIEQSKDIVVGKVANVTDGLDERGIPYTEVTLEVTESIRGTIDTTYTFRQFGLIKPRPTADGKRTMMPAPPGFPRYKTGEELVLMLRPEASWTGFRMPAGITRGKFEVTPGRVANDANNAGLFNDVHLEKGLADERESRMITAGGPANPDTFLSFLRRAVKDRWVERGRLAHAKPRSVR